MKYAMCPKCGRRLCTQMYKELVEKANLNLRRGEKDTAILKRNTYFVLDEFANLPKFDNIEGMVTVARSRGIRFLFVLQSYSQLTAKYGRDIGDIIKTNCNVKIFIGSDDSETRKEFSELCGNKKIKQFSVNTNAENPASSNTGATTQPLIISRKRRLTGRRSNIFNGRKTAKRKANMSMTNLPKNCA